QVRNSTGSQTAATLSGGEATRRTSVACQADLSPERPEDFDENARSNAAPDVDVARAGDSLCNPHTPPLRAYEKHGCDVDKGHRANRECEVRHVPRSVRVSGAGSGELRGCPRQR